MRTGRSKRSPPRIAPGAGETVGAGAGAGAARGATTVGLPPSLCIRGQRIGRPRSPPGVGATASGGADGDVPGAVGAVGMGVAGTGRSKRRGYGRRPGPAPSPRGGSIGVAPGVPGVGATTTGGGEVTGAVGEAGVDDPGTGRPKRGGYGRRPGPALSLRAGQPGVAPGAPGVGGATGRGRPIQWPRPGRLPGPASLSGRAPPGPVTHLPPSCGGPR